MKTEMKMLDNGNYESVIRSIQHICKDKERNWKCIEFSSRVGLFLSVNLADPDEDEHLIEVEVNFCPFCGYEARKK